MAVHRRMRALFFGAAVLLATAAGRAAAADSTTTTGDHAAKKGSKDSCSSLSDDCGFVTAADLAPVEAAAVFALTTDAEGNVSCDVVDGTEATESGCRYNADSETVEMALACDEGYVSGPVTCAPYVTNGDGTEVNFWGTQNVVNALGGVVFCGMPVAAPIPPSTSSEFLLYADCVPDFFTGGDALKRTMYATKAKGLAAKLLGAAKKN